MNATIIEKDGKPEFAVISYADYRHFLELLEDEADAQGGDGDGDVREAREHEQARPVMVELGPLALDVEARLQRNVAVDSLDAAPSMITVCHWRLLLQRRWLY